MTHQDDAAPGTAESVLAAMPDGILVVDPDGMVTFANQGAEELLRFDHGELAGHELDRLIPPSVRAGHHVLPSGPEAPIPMAGGQRVAAVRADGTQVAVTVALAAWSGGRTIAVMRDATQATELTAQLATEQRLLRLVADLSAVMAGSGPGSGAILDVATRMLADSIGDSCIVSLIDEEAGLLRPVAFHHRDPEGRRVTARVLAGRPLKLGEGVPGTVAQTGQRIVLADMPDDEIRRVTDEEFHAYLDEHPMSAFDVEPLVSSGETIGTLLMSRSRAYTDEEQTTVEDLAGRIALAVDRARLFEREQAALTQLETTHNQLRAVTDNVAAMVGYWDRDLRNGFANRMYTEYFGLTPDEIHGQPITDVLGPDLVERNRPYLERVLAGEPEVTFDVPMVDVGGRARRMQVTYTPNLVDGEVVGFYVVASDVTEHVMATEALQRSEERLRLLADRYRMLAENASDVVFRIGADMTLQWISPSVGEVFNLRVEDMVGRPVTELWHPDDRERVLDRLRQRSAEPADYEARFLVTDGEYRWFAVTSRPVRGEDGEVVGRIGSLRDIESQVAARQAVVHSEKLFRLALENAPSGMAVVDLDRRFLEVNPTLCRMVGRDADWLLQHRVPDVLDPDDDLLDLRRRAMLLAGGDPTTTDEVRLRASGGGTVWVQHQIGLLRDDDGTPLSFVSQFIDVTEARESREALQYVASHDQLTGVCNRSELLQRMTRVLGHRPRHGTSTAVLFVDVDDLKPFNDRLGHAAGDALLVAIAERLQEQVRGHDVVARVGGDEFVVFLTELAHPRDAHEIADKVLAAIRQPIDVDGSTVTTSVSIGLAAARAGEDPETVIRRADVALYRAKGAGGDTSAV